MRATRHSVPPTEWNIESSRKLASIDYAVGGNFIGVHGWHRAERRFSSNRAKTRRRLASVLSILSITPRVRLKTLPAAVETFERRTRSPQPELTREAREEAREDSRGTFERDVTEKSREMSQHPALRHRDREISCWGGNFYASLSRIVLQPAIHLTATVKISVETYREGITCYFLIIDRRYFDRRSIKVRLNCSILEFVFNLRFVRVIYIINDIYCTNIKIITASKFY